ncbi:LptF/LptG family permease [Candidatus Kinetoplastidibacterium galati]|uniref:Lipopolysaccharide export system permease protein n=1 Tax=Candidatus Kinetoplastidibacterium galati TCC219 TaxID=1208921 RepID=M1LUB9_9PROT|nr:LptF/LptG family permease [Candidatus Kinetoplastibacterium galatii]AGF49152.1 lipopolysaccharide export system permease protein [Candidatus Kinetoplastibacterium galatii TCC219]
MTSIFNRFTTNEIINRFFKLFLVLSLIWIGFLIIRLITHFQVLSLKVICSISSLSLITASPIIIQVAMFIAVLLTVIRSSTDNEMIVWLSSGLSLKNWFNPVIKISIPISIVVLILSLFISPLAYREIDTISDNYSQENKENVYKKASGRFIEFRDNNSIFFAEKCNGDSLSFSNVFINKIIEDGFLSIIVAKEVSFVINKGNNSFISMYDADRFDIPISNTSGLNSLLYHFDNYVINFNNEFTLKNSKTKSLKCSSLVDLIGNNSLESMAHIAWRLSYFMLSLNLAFLAVPLGVLNSRKESFIKLFPSLLICLLYISLTNLVRTWIISQNISLYSGLFIPHILVMLVNLFLMTQILDLNSYIRRSTNFL